MVRVGWDGVGGSVWLKRGGLVWWPHKCVIRREGVAGSGSTSRILKVVAVRAVQWKCQQQCQSVTAVLRSVSVAVVPVAVRSRSSSSRQQQQQQQWE